ncbi:TetR/AcrR family transcriptional regulator [Lapidilactobacillus bayanensis]|uniref:TetR/AcrR family transcriptional regulator n=1 Tax=Lapidilactobacillus bayanensis TaxID=2485998 RepID=UPI000F7665D3|nr:TetR/AcrR family transcriptional regulator [Lapidilactobacillus bayanensis]
MTKHDDFIKTHQHLLDAVLALMQSTPAAKISVTQVVKYCQVNRSTFYLHFIDLPTALNELEATLIGAIKICFDNVPPDWMLRFDRKQELSFYQGILQTIAQNYRGYQVLLGKNGDPNFLIKMKDELSKYLAPELTVNHTVKPEIRLALRQLIISGLVDAILLWVQTRPQLTIDEMAELLLYSRHNAPLEMVKQGFELDRN